MVQCTQEDIAVLIEIGTTGLFGGLLLFVTIFTIVLLALIGGLFALPFTVLGLLLDPLLQLLEVLLQV